MGIFEGYKDWMDELGGGWETGAAVVVVVVPVRDRVEENV